jgi:hypothetical protein
MNAQNEYRSLLPGCLIALTISLGLWVIIAAIVVLIERLI